jgi:hypothetical protein
METGQVDAQRHLDYVRHREPPELRGGPRRGAHNDVERGSGVPVQPVDQLPHGQARRPEHLRQRGQAVVGDHHRPDAIGEPHDLHEPIIASEGAGTRNAT